MRSFTTSGRNSARDVCIDANGGSNVTTIATFQISTRSSKAVDDRRLGYFIHRLHRLDNSSHYCPNVFSVTGDRPLKEKKLSPMKFVIDLNSSSANPMLSQLLRKGMADEFWQIDLFTTNGLSSGIRVSPMRRALPRQLQTQELLLLGPVSVYGLCAANLSREFARHRSLPACATNQALPSRHSWPSLAQYLGPCELSTRLAHLRRLCTSADYSRPRPLRRRQLRGRIGPDGLRARCHDY